MGHLVLINLDPSRDTSPHVKFKKDKIQDVRCPTPIFNILVNTGPAWTRPGMRRLDTPTKQRVYTHRNLAVEAT